MLHFSVFFDRFIWTFFIRFVFLPVSPRLSVVLLSLLPLHFSFCHVFWFFTPPLLSFLIFSSICTSFFLSPRLSLFLASLQSHKIWSWLSIYSARGSVAMTTKLEARAPGSYFWSSAVMLDTAFSSALSLSVFLSLSLSLPFCCSFCLSLSLTLHCSLFSLSLCPSLCLIKDRLVKAASLGGPSLVSDCSKTFSTLNRECFLTAFGRPCADYSHFSKMLRSVFFKIQTCRFHFSPFLSVLSLWINLGVFLCIFK